MRQEAPQIGSQFPFSFDVDIFVLSPGTESTGARRHGWNEISYNVESASDKVLE